MAKSKKVVVPASIIRRMIAFLIDVIILEIVIFSPLSALVNKIIPGADFNKLNAAIQSNPLVANILLFVIITAGVFALLYFSLLEYKLGATIGKKIMKLKVVTDKEPMKYWQAFVRSLFVIPVFPFMLFWIIDPLYLAMSRTNMRLLERFSRTKVIQMVTI